MSREARTADPPPPPPPKPRQSSPEPGDLLDRAGREGLQDLGDELAPLLGAGMVDRAQLRVAVPCQGELVVRVPGLELGGEPGDLLGGEALGTDLRSPADPVERVPECPRWPKVSCCTLW